MFYLSHQSPRRYMCILGVFLLLVILPLSLVAKKKQKPPSTTVFSEVRKTYKREMLPCGRWKPETYAFGEGALLDEEGDDESLSSLTFKEIGETLSHALLLEDYHPTPSPEATDLLILVSWGKTIPHDNGLHDMALSSMGDVMSSLNEDTAESESTVSDFNDGEFTQMMMMQDMARRARDKANRYNSTLLGYRKELSKMDSFLAQIGPLKNYHDELVHEIETPRYFVIMQAFDFQKAWKEKQMELLWVTRFSIRAKNRFFDEELANMAAAAAESFGNKNGKLLRRAKPAEVIIKDLEYLGIEK